MSAVFAPPPDREDRDRARFSLGANVVVEAGAGTGKTTLLTDRILLLALAGAEPMPIERIVALTFTEKAAGEIKARVAERLAETARRLSETDPPTARDARTEEFLSELRGRYGRTDAELLARSRAALEDLDRAEIGTIHSFCARLLRLHPVEAGLDPSFRVDEGAAFDRLFEAEWAAWLDSELGERPPRRAAWLELLGDVDLDDLEQIARALSSESFELSGVGESDPASARELRRLAARARSLGEGREKTRGKILEALDACARRLEAAATAAESADPPLDSPEVPLGPNASWPTAWEEDGDAAAFYAAARSLAGAVTPRGEAMARRAARLLRPFCERTRREYARRGWISFDGLVRRARDLVRDDSAVREESKVRFAALLIDEFQDTDPAQGELMLFLAEKIGGLARRALDVEPGPGRIFVVGDPKQSIYRFRGADISAYQSFVRRLTETGATFCRLTANFRSVPGVVEPVNAVFAKTMSAREGLQPDYAALRPVRAPSGDGVAVELTIVADDDGAAAAKQDESEWIASWIADRVRRGAGGEGWTFKDIAILLRSSSSLPPLLETFKRRGIPYAVEIERFFFESPESADFLNLLRALEDPGDRIAYAGLLRGPLGGLRDGSLARLSAARRLEYRRDPPADILDSDEWERAVALCATLRRLRTRVGRVPLGDLVGSALDETRLTELASRAYHGQQTASNLQKLRRLAVTASDEDGSTLKEFVAYVREASKDSRREGESPLADESLDAVRVMTMHKSKGLEFPIVILPNLSAKSGARGGKPAVRRGEGGAAGIRVGDSISACAALADAREKEMEAMESLRLLYVAMTRAKSKLILLGRSKPGSGSLSGHLLKAGAWPENDHQGLIPAAAPPTVGAATPAAPSAVEPGEAAASVTAWVARRIATTAALSGRTRAPSNHTAAPPPRAGPSGKGAPGAEIGRLCHRVLQAWDFRQGGDLAAALAAARRLLERGDPAGRWDEASAAAEDILRGFFSSAAARSLAGAQILGREIPFSFAEGAVVVRGAADVIARVDGRLAVIDFKSEPVEPASAAEQRAWHAEQGRAYVEAVRRAWGEEADFRVLFLRRPEL